MTAIPGDAAVTGVAMLAGIGAGIYRDADEAVARCVHGDPPVEPDPRAHARYAEVYAGYRALVESAEVRR